MSTFKKTLILATAAIAVTLPLAACGSSTDGAPKPTGPLPTGVTPPTTVAPVEPTTETPTPAGVGSASLSNGMTFTFTVPAGSKYTENPVEIAAIIGEDTGATVPKAAFYKQGINPLHADPSQVVIVSEGTSCSQLDADAVGIPSAIEKEVYQWSDTDPNVKWFMVPASISSSCSPIIVRQGTGFPSWFQDTVVNGGGSLG